jgi:hypothetical protein
MQDDSQERKLSAEELPAGGVVDEIAVEMLVVVTIVAVTVE